MILTLKTVIWLNHLVSSSLQLFMQTVIHVTCKSLNYMIEKEFMCKSLQQVQIQWSIQIHMVYNYIIDQSGP